eukprot:scaffold74783_cov59-Phaeocystis_antarctica.AAC.2
MASATIFQKAVPRVASERTNCPRQWRCNRSTASNVASPSPLMSVDMKPSAGTEPCIGMSAGMEPSAALGASIHARARAHTNRFSQRTQTLARKFSSGEGIFIPTRRGFLNTETEI